MSPFTTHRSQSVAALGEAKLIHEIRRWLGSATPQAPGGIGDDCAVLAGSLRDQLVAVDPVIYGEHFDDKVPARGVGAKLFNRNLSDIASMGGRPRAAVVALALDDHVKIEWLRDFYLGLAAIARKRGWLVENWAPARGAPRRLLPIGPVLTERERLVPSSRSAAS